MTFQKDKSTNNNHAASITFKKSWILKSIGAISQSIWIWKIFLISIWELKMN